MARPAAARRVRLPAQLQRARTGSARRPFDEFSADEAPDVSDVQGDDPAVALRQDARAVRHRRHRDHHAQGRAGARHDGQRLHVGLARAAARARVGGPPDEDVQPAPRGLPLRRERALRDPERAVGPLRRTRRARACPSRASRSCARPRSWTARSRTSWPACQRSYWGGDHSLFLGRVEYARHHSGSPLLFHGGRYERLGQLGAHPAVDGCSRLGRRQLGEPGAARARLVPEHREERLVQREVAAAPVARVDEVHLGRVEAGLHRDQVGHQRPAVGRGLVGARSRGR